MRKGDYDDIISDDDYDDYDEIIYDDDYHDMISWFSCCCSH